MASSCGERLFECVECSKTYHSEEGLRQHLVLPPHGLRYRRSGDHKVIPPEELPAAQAKIMGNRTHHRDSKQSAPKEKKSVVQPPSAALPETRIGVINRLGTMPSSNASADFPRSDEHLAGETDPGLPAPPTAVPVPVGPSPSSTCSSPSPFSSIPSELSDLGPLDANAFLEGGDPLLSASGPPLPPLTDSHILAAISHPQFSSIDETFQTLSRQYQMFDSTERTRRDISFARQAYLLGKDDRLPEGSLFADESPGFGGYLFAADELN